MDNKYLNYWCVAVNITNLSTVSNVIHHQSTNHFWKLMLLDFIHLIYLWHWSINNFFYNFLYGHMFNNFNRVRLQRIEFRRKNVLILWNHLKNSSMKIDSQVMKFILEVRADQHELFSLQFCQPRMAAALEHEQCERVHDVLVVVREQSSVHHNPVRQHSLVNHSLGHQNLDVLRKYRVCFDRRWLPDHWPLWRIQQ